MDIKEKLSFCIGMKTNRETNDYLRCLWSRMAFAFGKLAWMYAPLRVNTTIFVGQASVGENLIFEVRFHYKKRGCLSVIDFLPSGEYDILQIKCLLKQCVNEAFHYEKYLREVQVLGYLDQNISFKKRSGRCFVIDDNKVSLLVYGYDKDDTFTLFKEQLQQVCNLLTFDTLRYITIKDTLIEEIREKHNFSVTLVNADTGEKTDELVKNEMYHNLEVSDRVSHYIDSYLERPFGYELQYTNFDKSVQLFAQGIRNEEMSSISTGLPEPYAEQAIVNYMSSLEVITLNDKEPQQCKCCGQLKYSIAKRVTDLANRTFPGLGVFVKEYYGERSKYVHAGSLLSTNNYIGRSFPLMSTNKNSRTVMIKQIARVPNELKEMVKSCIEWHEANVGS